MLSVYDSNKNLPENNNNPQISKTPKLNITSPFNKLVKNIFTSIGKGEVDIPDINKLHDKTSMPPPKELLAYDLMYRESKILNKWRNMKSEHQLLSHMKSNGYTPVEVSFSEGNQELKTTFFSKDNYKIVYSMNADIAQEKFLPLMVDDTRFENKKWIFNYQNKLCASIVKPEGSFYWSEAKVGLVLGVQPKHILEVFPRDKLSPTGFRLSDIKDDYSPDKVSVENQMLADVHKYIGFQKNYKNLLLYCDSIAKACLSPALSDPTLSEEAYSLLLALDQTSKKLAWEPLKGEFHEMSGMTKRLIELRDFIKLNSGVLDASGAYESIFQADGKEEIKTITAALDLMVNYSQELDKKYLEYNKFVLSPKAQEWGKKYGHLDTSKTTAYLAGKINTPVMVTHEKNESPYNELNIEVPKRKDDPKKQIPGEIEVVGLLIDRNIFDNKNGTLTMNIDQLKKEIVLLEQQIKNEKTPPPKDLSDKLWILNSRMSMYKLCQDCKKNNIPILCT